MDGGRLTGSRPGDPSIERGDAGIVTSALIMAGIFAFVTSTMMIGPLLLDLSRDFGVSLGSAGLLAAATAIPQAIGAPFAGLVSDRFGRRPMIVLALVGVGVTGLAAGVAGSFAVLVGIRVLAGLVGACGPTSTMASVGDLFPPARRARAMAWFNMGFSVAAIAGVPAVGVISGVLGWRWAFAISGVVFLAIALLVRLWFPWRQAPVTDTSVLTTYRAVWAVPRLLHVLAANLVERSLFTMVTLYLPAFLMLRHRLSAAEVAPFLSLVAVGAIGGNLLGGWIGDRLPRPAIFIAAQLAAGVVGLALFGLSLGLVPGVVLAASIGLASATSRPGFLAFGSELAPRHRGALFGLIGLTNQAGLAIGSAVGALVIEVGGYGALAAVAAAQGCLAAALAIPLLRRRGPRWQN